MNLSPKTEPTPVKKSPFALKEGKRGFLLVPFEETARARTLEMLAEQGFAYEDEDERRAKGMPKVVFQIKLTKLTSEDVVFTAVAVVSKLDPRKQPREWSLKVSKPTEAKQFIGSGDEDGDVLSGPFVDALQSSVNPMTMRISQDHILKIYPF